MKQLLKSITISPKHVFRGLKKSRSVSKSEPASFSSAYSSSSDSTSSSSDAAKPRHAAILPARTRSDEWSSSDEIPPPRLDFVQAFKVIDRDNDGKITRLELESILRRVGGKVSDQELAEMIEEIDRDGDGCIRLEELETVGSVVETAGAAEDELREAFEFFDADHDGKITAEELHSVFVALGDERCTIEECRRMIEGVDKNRDGFVCFEDFAQSADFFSISLSNGGLRGGSWLNS